MRRKAAGAYGHLDPSEGGVWRWLVRQRTGVALPVLLILAVFLILGGIRAWTTGGGDVDASGVASFMWRDIAPELAPLINQVDQCARALRESVPVEDMQMLYTCAVDDVEHMQGGFGCVNEGSAHLERILGPEGAGDDDAMLQMYKAFEDESRGHGKSAKTKCGTSRLAVSATLAQALSPNVTLMIEDRRPCHSTYSFVSTGQGPREALGRKDTVFASTHHLGSISYRKFDGAPCMDKVLAQMRIALGESRMQYPSVQQSFRGLYWYPPNGFTEWHTDGGHVEGWRIYVAQVDVPRESWFVYKQDGKRHAIPDVVGQANMFKVRMDRPFWHAVASRKAHRMSTGIAVSEAYAQEILARIRAAQPAKSEPSADVL